MWLLKEAECVESLLQTLPASCLISQDIDPETLWIIYFLVVNDSELLPANPSGIPGRTGRSGPPSTSGNQMERVDIAQGCTGKFPGTLRELG